MWEGALFSYLAEFGERVWWVPLQPSNRRLFPLDSRLEQGRYLRPMDGSNTVFIGTASGVVKARTIKRLPPSERWTGSLLDEARGSELTQGALEDEGGRVGIRAPVLQPQAGVPLPPLVPEFRQVRRAPLRRTDFEQFGYTNNCPGCAIARTGHKRAVDHSEQCRSRMEAILLTTTEGHIRLERPRERLVQFAEEPGVMEFSRKRHRPEGEGAQPLAPSASGVRSNYQDGSSSSSGSALPIAPPPAPPPLEPPPLAKRSLEQETEMTDATVEQQEKSKRRKEHPEVPQAADRSISSSSSESSTDTEMGVVDVCTILCHNSEVSERDRVTVKRVAVAEEREGGPVTLDLMKWDLSKADCRTRCRKLKKKQNSFC